ncbi:HNH endonuclease signature motif containing protein [Euzebya rosea]|uniref:HNH endonuclease signature motif containing protein n=1 Tax=Euzebya rosea TaxID=2052804 RepID=UPI000D3E1165|nr:HNH endonuclease signature motif containing protein [Euzebya rosea]
MTDQVVEERVEALGWLQPDDIHTPGPHPAGPDATPVVRHDVSTVGRLVALLGEADRIIAEVIGLIRHHRHHARDRQDTGGLRLDRFLALATGRTGTDIGRLMRAERTLTRMPAVDAAFADGRLSWSQVHQIVGATRDLTAAQTTELDDDLAGPLATTDPTADPDAIVRTARDWATQILHSVDAERFDPADRAFLRVEPDLFGGAAFSGYDRIEAVMTILEAAEAAADRPSPPGEVRTDADGQEVPAELLPATARQAQLAEGLRRIAASYLAGATPGTTTDTTTGTDALPPRPARPSVSVVIDTTDPHGPIGRLLARWHGGPIPLTRLTTERMLCDPALSTVIVDDGRPVAISDHTGPITARHYRTLRAVDRGCRMPGCHAPAQHTDAHHIIPREQGGPTSTDNMLLLCRSCHTTLHDHHIGLEMHRHTRAVTITLHDGRTFTSTPT